MDNRENQLPSRFDARYRINNTGLIKTASIRPSVLLNSCNSIVSSASAENLRGKQTISREERGIDRSRNSRDPTALNSRRNFPARNDPLPSSPPKTPSSLSFSLQVGLLLILCLPGQHRAPLIKPRDGWAVKLYKLLISRETYTSRKRDVARNRRKVILPSFLSSSSSYPPRNNYRQPDPIQVSPGSSSHGSL